MLIALDKNKERISIENTIPSEKYYCQFCNEELITKKGHIRCHHFSHKPNSNCVDSKWYDMSEWNINWQNRFPVSTQEILKIDDNGKKHIADVLINQKTVIEFQHSNLPYEVFNDRNEFYNKMGYRVIWIFDGNKIFENGYSGGIMNYTAPLKPLSKQKKIPNYLNIFIEGTMNYNLFEEEGKFLYHIGDLASIGISFNGKVTINDFITRVKNDSSFDFVTTSEFIEEEIKEQTSKCDTLPHLFERFKNTSIIRAYNTKNDYFVQLDKYNYKRLKEGKKGYGKLKKGKLSSYPSYTSEIYYAYDPDWILEWHLDEKDEY